MFLSQYICCLATMLENRYRRRNDCSLTLINQNCEECPMIRAEVTCVVRLIVNETTQPLVESWEFVAKEPASCLLLTNYKSCTTFTLRGS